MDDTRVADIQRGMRARARTAVEASKVAISSQQAAALRGKARGYREAADMLESLLRIGTVHRKYEEVLPPPIQIEPEAIIDIFNKQRSYP